MTTRTARRAAATNGDLTPIKLDAAGPVEVKPNRAARRHPPKRTVPASPTQPEPVAAGQISVAESNQIRTRREAAAQLRAKAQALADEAQTLATAAVELEASVLDFAKLATARRGLGIFVRLDPDGTIWVLPEPATEGLA